jgi:hypothetical protein
MDDLTWSNVFTLEDEIRRVNNILHLLHDDEYHNMDLYVYYELINLFKHASYELKNNKDVIMSILNASRILSRLLEYASDILKNDDETVLTAVKNDGGSIVFASLRLKNNKRVILTAVTNCGNVLKIIPDNLKDDENTLAAVTRDGASLEYVPESLMNIEKARIAVSNYGLAVKFIPKHLIDKEIALVAVKNTGRAIKFIPDFLKEDKDIVYAAVKQCGNAIEYVNDSFKDVELGLIAVSDEDSNSYCGIPHKHLPNFLRDDEKIIFEAIKHNGFALYYVSNQIIIANPKLAVYAIDTSGKNVLSCVPYDNCLVEKNYDLELDNEQDYYENHYGHLKNYDQTKHTYDYVYIHIKDNILSHENFLLFLNSVCIPKLRCVSRKLTKHGYYHSIKILKLIADFTGIIYANDYCVYKRVLVILN